MLHVIRNVATVQAAVLSVVAACDQFAGGAFTDWIQANGGNSLLRILLLWFFLSPHALCLLFLNPISRELKAPLQSQRVRLPSVGDEKSNKNESAQLMLQVGRARFARITLMVPFPNNGAGHQSVRYAVRLRLRQNSSRIWARQPMPNRRNRH